MFHAVGLKVIDNKLKKSEVWLQSKSVPTIAESLCKGGAGRLKIENENLSCHDRHALLYTNAFQL